MTFYKIKDSTEKIQIGKLVCFARTYIKHAKELQNPIPKHPVLFLKPESAIIFNDDTIYIPRDIDCVHHEVELGVVIGKEGTDISSENALDYVYGYVLALDITARDIQTDAKKQGLPWSIAKGYDTFAPISEVLQKNQISNPNILDIQLKVNGVVKQQSNTKFLRYTVEQIIECSSSIMTLKKGDLILTGTPEGVGPLIDGDQIEASLGGILLLSNDVKKRV